VQVVQEAYVDPRRFKKLKGLEIHRSWRTSDNRDAGSLFTGTKKKAAKNVVLRQISQLYVRADYVYLMMTNMDHLHDHLFKKELVFCK
jgi:hypothetical protein